MPDDTRDRGRPTLAEDAETVPVMIKMPTTLRDEIDESADREGVSRSEWIRRALRDQLTAPDQEDGAPLYRDLPESEIKEWDRENDTVRREGNWDWEDVVLLPALRDGAHWESKFLMLPRE